MIASITARLLVISVRWVAQRCPLYPRSEFRTRRVARLGHTPVAEWVEERSLDPWSGSHLELRAAAESSRAGSRQSTASSHEPRREERRSRTAKMTQRGRVRQGHCRATDPG